eukprot:gene3014-7319_t
MVWGGGLHDPLAAGWIVEVAFWTRLIGRWPGGVATRILDVGSGCGTMMTGVLHRYAAAAALPGNQLSDSDTRQFLVNLVGLLDERGGGVYMAWLFGVDVRRLRDAFVAAVVPAYRPPCWAVSFHVLVPTQIRLFRKPAGGGRDEGRLVVVVRRDPWAAGAVVGAPARLYAEPPLAGGGQPVVHRDDTCKHPDFVTTDPDTLRSNPNACPDLAHQIPSKYKAQVRFKKGTLESAVRVAAAPVPARRRAHNRPPPHSTTYTMLQAGSGATVAKGDKVTGGGRKRARVHVRAREAAQLAPLSRLRQESDRRCAASGADETGKKFWSTKDKGQQPF